MGYLPFLFSIPILTIIMSSVSKSLFTNSIVPSNTRSLFIPIVLSSGSTYAGDVVNFLSNAYINILRIIETQYGANMANKTYELIPSNYDDYTNLVSDLKLVQSKTTNSTMTLLLKIAEDTLIGSVNSYALYGDNLLLQIDKTTLEKRIDDILTDKNTVNVANTFGVSTMSLNKSFKLAPVFNYYIMIYGLPTAGTGFDPVKINFLVSILTNKGIDPYN